MAKVGEIYEAINGRIFDDQRVESRLRTWRLPLPARVSTIRHSLNDKQSFLSFIETLSDRNESGGVFRLAYESPGGKQVPPCITHTYPVVRNNVYLISYYI